MARRGGRPGKWLIPDDYYGITRYNNEVRTDYWGNLATKPLKRNLQEIATPLNDPEPVQPVRAPNYEVVNPATTDVVPTFVGSTTSHTNLMSAAYQAGAVT
jgi:hypothetical protein